MEKNNTQEQKSLATDTFIQATPPTPTPQHTQWHAHTTDTYTHNRHIRIHTNTLTLLWGKKVPPFRELNVLQRCAQSLIQCGQNLVGQVKVIWSNQLQIVQRTGIVDAVDEELGQKVGRVIPVAELSHGHAVKVLRGQAADHRQVDRLRAVMTWKPRSTASVKKKTEARKKFSNTSPETDKSPFPNKNLFSFQLPA